MPVFTRQEMRDGKNDARASFSDALSHMVTFIARRASQEEQRRTIMVYHHPVLTALFAGVGATRLKLPGQ